MSFAVGYVTNSEQMRFLYPTSVATVFEKNNIICGCSATREKVDLVKNQETVRRAPLGQGHNKVSQSQYYVFCW